MKTITYRGERYEVEDWVNFVAMDSDGMIYGYDYEPELSCGEWIPSLGRTWPVGDEPTDWEVSLEKV